jgi:hypothetical protein
VLYVRVVVDCFCETKGIEPGAEDLVFVCVWCG